MLHEYIELADFKSGRARELASRLAEVVASAVGMNGGERPRVAVLGNRWRGIIVINGGVLQYLVEAPKKEEGRDYYLVHVYTETLDVIIEVPKDALPLDGGS